MVTSLAITLGVFVVGMMVVLEEKERYETSSDWKERGRYAMLFLGLVASCAALLTFLMKNLYFMAQWEFNKQHFGNVYWLQQYIHALRH